MLIHVKIKQCLLVKHLIADEAFGCDGLFESGSCWTVEGFFRIGGRRASEHKNLLFFEINEQNLQFEIFFKNNMQKQRNSKSKINGKIIMMQNDLMSKLATLEYEPKQSTDELGFPSRSSQFDSLTNLLSKAKQVTTSNKEKIQVARKSSSQLSGKKPKTTKRKQQTGTFLTGIGLGTEAIEQKIAIEEEETRILQREFYGNGESMEEEDADEMIKEMIKKSQEDDLAELRRMIKETDSSLQDYGKQLQRTRKQVLGMAEKFCEIDYKLVDRIYRYEDRGY